MEKLTSRKNELVRRIRLLGMDPAARREAGEFVCGGEKLLREALDHGAEITAVLWDGPPRMEVPCGRQYLLPP